MHPASDGELDGMMTVATSGAHAEGMASCEAAAGEWNTLNGWCAAAGHTPGGGHGPERRVVHSCGAYSSGTYILYICGMTPGLFVAW